MPDTSHVIAYFFTTFPQSTETFLQREIIAMKQHGAQLRLYSMWGGGESFRGLPVRRFNKWRLLTLLWLIPYESWRRPAVLGELLSGLVRRRPPSWLNFWENMLGAGFACIFAREFRRDPPALIHATWAGAPATAAYVLSRLNGHRYTAAAHAYDIYEHGGDWWLTEKLQPAIFVHTSTMMARRSLTERRVDATKIICIRRGLDRIPPVIKPLRPSRSPLHLLCVARLVEKKGLNYQLRVYADLKAANIPFVARIVGDGPLRQQLEKEAGHLGIAGELTFTGHLPQHEVWEQLAWADVLLHTGIVASTGDRDGLPNVIPEAMSIGVLVISSPAAATTEAVTQGITGLIAPVEVARDWVSALQRLSTDDYLAEKLRTNARRWVEQNFDAHENARRLLIELEQAITPPTTEQESDVSVASS